MGGCFKHKTISIETNGFKKIRGVSRSLPDGEMSEFMPFVELIIRRKMEDG
ncbi:MAG: hypothetical protein HZB80_00360 [Deltaproteobacteria bacterium]|nr:hypothetical protein [Deltaproteobacteria bacterium]